MTTTTKQHTSERYYIVIEVDRNVYRVPSLPLIGDHMCGYPVAECTYTMSERDKAIRTFNRYKKKYI